MNRTTHYRYDLGKHLLQVLRPAEEKDGRILYQKISFSYDENGNKTKEVRHGGYWNEEGNLAGKSGTDLCLTFVYDARNRLIRIKDGLGAAVRYCYDVKGNRIHEERQVSDTVKQVIRYTYDRAGRLTEEKEELNSGLEGIPGEDKSAITRYRYDENGNRTEIITPEGYQVLREYDACDRLISERSVDKKNGIDQTAVVAYDKAGNITKVARQGRGSSEWDISYDYDLKDRLTNVEDYLGPVFRYEYNKNDQVVEALLPPAGEQPEQQRGYRYRYDHRGNVLEKADTAGTVLERNEYLADGALARRVTADGNELSYTYGANGQESEIHTARSKKKEQAAQRYTYDSRGRIIGSQTGIRTRPDMRWMAGEGSKYLASNYGVSENDGLSMLFETIYYNPGGRHGQTATYGSNQSEYLNLSPRDALAADVKDMKRILQEQGLYDDYAKQ